MSTEVQPRSTQEVQSSIAFSTERRIKQTVQLMRRAWVKIAADLYQFNEQQMWRDLGYDNFDAWIADPDVDMERRWAYQLIQNWREVVINGGAEPKALDGCEPSKIPEVLPAVRRGYVSLDEALEDVRTLSRTDLRERYRPQGQTHQSPNGAKPDTTTHYDAEQEPAWARCPTCGSRVKEEEIRGQ